MLIYYLILAFILIYAFPMCIYKPSVLKKNLYVVTVFFILYIVAAFRYGTGNDYFNYRSIFLQYCDSASVSEAFGIVIEPAFSFLNWTLSRFTRDIIFVNSVYSLIILFPVAYVIAKQSKNVWISCFLYICLTFYYTSFNFTRQSMAASFVFLAFYLFSKKKYLFAVLSVTFAVCFHLSALIFIPVFMLCFIKPEKYLFAAYAVLTGVCYLAADYLFDLGARVLAALINPRYADYLGSRFTQSLGWHFILLPLLCFLIIYSAYHTNWRIVDKNSFLYVNLSFFSTVIWFFITKIMILERFSMYFYIFTILSVPSVVNYFFGDFNWIADKLLSRFTLFNSDYNKRAEELKEINVKNSKVEKKRKKDFYNIGLISFLLKTFDKNGYYARKIRKIPMYTDNLRGNINLSRNKSHKILSYSVFGLYALSCLIYHSYGLTVSGRGFHGVVPYKSGIADIARITLELSGRGKINLLFEAGGVYEYLALLTGNDLTVLVSGIPSEKPYLDSVTQATLKRMGFEYDFSDYKADCIIAVFQNGKKLYEQSGNERLEYNTELFGSKVFITSDLTEASIIIDGKEESLGNKGLNFTVLDNTGRIISAVTVYHHDVYGNLLTSFKQ